MDNPMNPVATFIQQTYGIIAVEMQKLRHDPWELASRAIQPVLWLLLFGEVMAKVRGVSPGDVNYLDFLSAGILAQSVLFVAIFYGISAIWERDLGVVQRYLVSPAPRSALVIGKALSASVRALSQAVVVYILAATLGVGLSFDPLHMAGVLVAIVLGSGLFSTFSLIIACIVKTRERFMGIGQVLTMPIFFASNAIYPISLMPGWLRAIAHVNPLTYQVDALRSLMLTNSASEYGIATDLAVLAGVSALLTAVAAKMYERMGY
ncbi:MAG: ABC transporter permease [Rhizobiales bacterium]|nr:ABC transporter permease [Hyphomicrobiales bacterium]MBI3673587.1 ABC transporter permease [Hyphomicrobiales bacterium]